jgi:hypothetical protein
VNVRLLSFLTPELDGRECSNLRSGRFPLGNTSSTRQREIWLDSRAVLETMEKKIRVDLTEIEPETHQPSAQSLYRQHHYDQRISYRWVSPFHRPKRALGREEV